MSRPRTYAADEYWRKYLPFLPEVMRLPQDPVEEWWTWRGSQIHLDRLGCEKELVMLESCGHLPYEEPGVSQFRAAVDHFLCRVTRQCETKLHSREPSGADVGSVLSTNR